MKFKAVIFDLDGTLLDTIEDIGDSMNNVLEKNGLPVHDAESYKYFVGNGMRELVRLALPEDKRSESFIDDRLREMQAQYASGWAAKTRPYPGIGQMLDIMVEKDVKLSILSNKPDGFSKQVVDKLLPGWNFHPVFGERQGIPKKPDPSGALEIAEILGLEPGECLYAGDSGVDMKTAKAAGMYAVGVLWGFRKADELLQNGADILVAEPVDIVELLSIQPQF